MNLVMEIFACLILVLFCVILASSMAIFIYSRILDRKETREQFEKDIDEQIIHDINKKAKSGITKRNKNNRKINKRSV